MKNIRNLLVNPKINGKFGYAVLLVASAFIMTSCICGKKVKTCDYEKSSLDSAKTAEANIIKYSDKNADSCLYFYALKMPSLFLEDAYSKLPDISTTVPYTKKDSVTAVVNKIFKIPENYQTEKIRGAIRTGTKALKLWSEYPVAQNATQVAQSKFNECQRLSVHN